MKHFINSCRALALATLVAQPALAGDRPAPADTLAAAFGDTAGMAVARLDAATMDSTRGRLAPLLLPLSIAGLDLALIGAFWGVYLPNYVFTDRCSGCAGGKINLH
jgi:hypothetical protein